MEKLKLWLMSFLTRVFINVLCRLVKKRIFGKEFYDNAKKAGEKIIFILWHGRIIIPIFAHRNKGIRPLVSLSRDGEFTAMVLKGFGYEPIRGSSSKGGKEAFHKMKESLENSEIAIIPDGPRGPGRVLKPGCIYLAQQTGAVIIPVSFSCKRRKFLKGWDKHLIFPPFTECVMIYGEPIKIKENLNPEEIEKVRRDVERRLIELDEEADRLASGDNKNI